MGDCASREEEDDVQAGGSRDITLSKATHDKAKEELENLRKQVEDLQNQLAEAQKQRDQYLSCMKEKDAKAKTDKLKIKELKDKIEKLEKEIQDLQQKSARMNKDMSDMDARAKNALMYIQPIMKADREGDYESLKKVLAGMKTEMDDGIDELKKAWYVAPEKTQSLKKLGTMTGVGSPTNGTEKKGTPALTVKFGDFAETVAEVYLTGKNLLKQWEAVIATIKAVIASVAGEEEKISQRDAQRLYNAMKQAGLLGLALEKVKPDSGSETLVETILKILFGFFTHEGACVGNSLQKEIVRRVVACTRLEGFDFTDMQQCMSIVDKDEKRDADFLKRARGLIDTHEVPAFPGVLSALETILFFLKFLDKEDLALTYKLYKEKLIDQSLMSFIKGAEQQYSPGNELVDATGKDLLNEKDVMTLLKQLNQPRRGGDQMVDNLRKLFYGWATLMKEKFGLLVLPHHTQIVCMLMCLDFIVNPKPRDLGALIAEMSTGEGKSAVIANIALYLVVYAGKKVHVVVDDERLVERDFRTFQGLFAQFQNKRGKPVAAKLCVAASKKESKFKHDEAVCPRVDEEADIVYCEAKHVQSFYTHLAKQGGVDFNKVYTDRILVLDEVDALVIDEAPNVPFVYENEELSTFATQVAEDLCQHHGHVASVTPRTAAEKTLVRTLQQAQSQVKGWHLGQDYVYNEDENKYFLVQNGRVNQGAYSLALEFCNFAEHKQDKIHYQERLFIMNRARTFRKYERIVGLSGSVGSPSERDMLESIYRARFFKVPLFLETVRTPDGRVAHHEPTPRGVFLQDDQHKQVTLATTKAFEECQHVPVLIIAGDRVQADLFTQELTSLATAKGFRGNDKVLSLSQDLYEANPEKYKDNLYKCTLPIGRKDEPKHFRIAVTDPRGGRGTDYRVTDKDADEAGGLMLIILYIPKQTRDWIQYLGRTARQDREGQWMAVLDKQAYAEDEKKLNQQLQPRNAVETILQWGNIETKEKLVQTNGLYNRGLRTNEISEEVARLNLLKVPGNREIMVQLCNDFRRLSIAQIDAIAARMKGGNLAQIPTEAEEVGADTTTKPSGHAKIVCNEPRSFIITIDRSASMGSTDAGGGRSRFQVCVECIMNIFSSNVDDHDQLGIYSFESQINAHFPLAQKGPNSQQASGVISGMPGPKGGTMLYDCMLENLMTLKSASTKSKFLIVLTDGDDNMSMDQPDGGKVTALLREDIPGLNLIMITCGSKISPTTVELIKHWIELVKHKGRIGMYLPADDPSRLGEAFGEVQALIDEPDGETEL